MKNLNYLMGILKFILVDLHDISNTYNTEVKAIDDIKPIYLKYMHYEHDIDEIEIESVLHDVCMHINYDSVIKKLNINGLSVHTDYMPTLIFTDFCGNTYDYAYVDLKSSYNVTDLCYQSKMVILFNLSSVLDSSVYDSLEYDIKNDNVPKTFFYSVVSHDYDSATKDYVHTLTH